MKNFSRNKSFFILTLSAALFLAARPGTLGAAVLPPQTVIDSTPAGAAEITTESFSCSSTFCRESFEKTALLLDRLSPAERRLLEENPQLVSRGGSGLGLVIVLLAVIGITALILNATGHQLKVETTAGG